MAKRSEYIKCNCPACGVGLNIDLDDLTVLATGDTAKKPEPKKPESSANGSDADEGKQESSAASSGSQEREASTKKRTAGNPDNESDQLDSEENKGLGDW